MREIYHDLQNFSDEPPITEHTSIRHSDTTTH